MSSAIRIGCDATWASIAAGTDPCAHLSAWFPNHARPFPVPLTPRACLWVTDSPPLLVNALASALIGFLHLPIRQLTGPAYLTGWQDGNAAALTPVQHQAFVTALRTVTAMPDYLALHAQAGRLAVAWSCPAERAYR